MSREDEELGKLEKKVALAAAYMLASGHRLPGVRGWELRRRLGKNYGKIVEALDSRLREIGLRVKVVHDSEEKEDLDRARFYIVLRDSLVISDLPSLGYRMDELAILAATLAYLYSKNGRAPQREVSEMLESKYPRWRVEAALEKLARRGYLLKTEDGLLSVGWRAEVEVDRRELLRAFTEIAPHRGEPEGVSTEESGEERPEAESGPG